MSQEATVRTRHGTTDWFRIEKGVHKAVYCHLVYLTYIQGTSCEMLSWMTYKLEPRLLGETRTTSDMQMIPMAESEEELKSLLMRVKEESENLT